MKPSDWKAGHKGHCYFFGAGGIILFRSWILTFFFCFVWISSADVIHRCDADRFSIPKIIVHALWSETCLLIKKSHAVWTIFRTQKSWKSFGIRGSPSPCSNQSCSSNDFWSKMLCPPPGENSSYALVRDNRARCACSVIVLLHNFSLELKHRRCIKTDLILCLHTFEENSFLVLFSKI